MKFERKKKVVFKSTLGCINIGMETKTDSELCPQNEGFEEVGKSSDNRVGTIFDEIYK